MHTYSTAEAAAASGFSLDTLRYYERVGVVPEVRRTAGGRRAFSAADLKWLGLVRCLRDTGMPIAEILEFTRLMRDGEATVPARLALLEAHEERVEARIRRLREHHDQIRSKIETYRTGTTWTPAS